MPPSYAATAMLASYAAAAATCADRYAKVFYPMIRDADEKLVCCQHGAQAMGHHIEAAALLAPLGIELTGLVDKPLAERGLAGVEVLEAPSTWTDRAGFSAVVERAMAFQLRRLARPASPASAAPEISAIAAMATAALPRQEAHAAHGLMLLAVACATPEGLAAAQRAVHQLWPLALGLLDAGGERAADAAADTGTDRAELRAAFLDALGSALQPLGLTLPAPER